MPQIYDCKAWKMSLTSRQKREPSANASLKSVIILPKMLATIETHCKSSWTWVAAASACEWISSDKRLEGVHLSIRSEVVLPEC